MLLLFHTFFSHMHFLINIHAAYNNMEYVFRIFQLLTPLPQQSCTIRIPLCKKALLENTPTLTSLVKGSFLQFCYCGLELHEKFLPVEYTSILISAKNSLCKYNLVQHPGNPGTEWIEQTTCFLTPEHISWYCWAAGTDISCLILPVSLKGDSNSRAVNWNSERIHN